LAAIDASTMALNVNLREKIIFLRIHRRFSFRAIARHISQHDNQHLSHVCAKYWYNVFQNKGEAYVRSRTRELKSKPKVERVHMDFLEAKMRENPERSTVELQKLLQCEFQIHLSVSYICKLRRQLGWVSKSTRYGQMVRDINKEKRLAWAKTQRPLSYMYHLTRWCPYH
jgi:transposase